MLCGSNYIVYEAHAGVVASYRSGVSKIAADLEGLREDGQEFIRLPLCFYDGADDGVNLDSTGGVLSPSHAAQFAALLARIRSLDFKVIEIALCPQAGNSPFVPGFDRLETNWNMLARSLVPAVAGAGFDDYYFDLNNEGIPAPGQDQFLAYVRGLYARYWYVFKTAHTIGFSIQPDGGRLDRINEVYQGTFPARMSTHIYGGVETDAGKIVWGSGYEVFLAVDAALTKIGFRGELAIGECPNCDPTIQQEFEYAAIECGRNIPSIAQWPVDFRLPLVRGEETNVIPHLGGFQRLLDELRNPRA